MQKFIVFTDLDGTLLNHHDYDHSAALPALQLLLQHNIPVIPNTSKTAAELAELQVRMGLKDGFVFENGGGFALPGSSSLLPYLNTAELYSGASWCTNDERYVLFGANRREIIKRVQSVRDQLDADIRLMSELTSAELSEYTGLTESDAELALQRECGEPVIWQDTEQKRNQFCQLIAEANLRTLMGGRFLHVQGQVDKALGMKKVAALYQNLYPEYEIKTVALGDAPNDKQMLEAADYSVVVANSQGNPLQLEKTENVLYEKLEGPEGWNHAMHQLLKSWFS